MPSLFEVAQDMREIARRRGLTQAELTRGLALQLTYATFLKPELQPELPLDADLPAEIPLQKWAKCSLTLARPAVKPSELEVKIVKVAFAVPASASRKDSQFQITLEWEEPEKGE